MDRQEEVSVTESPAGPRVNASWRWAMRLQDWIRHQGIGTTLYPQPRTRRATLLLHTNRSADRIREFLQQAPR